VSLAELPERVCVKLPRIGEKCWDREQLVEVNDKLYSDLELLGLVERRGDGVWVNVSELGKRLVPCFMFVRAVTVLFGTFERFREEARRDPWGLLCFTYAYCLYYELYVRALSYGLPPNITPLDWDEEQVEYLAFLTSIMQVILEKVFKKEEVVKLFRAAFEV